MKIVISIILYIVLSIHQNMVWGYGSWQPQANQKGRINPNESLLIGSAQENLYIINQFQGAPGCYISCMGNGEGVHQISSRMWFHGLLRISGYYPTDYPSTNRREQTCYPSSYEKYYSVQDYYKQICNKAFPTCTGGCWGSADTGGFFTRRPLR